MNNPKSLIRSFVDKHLDGNIDALATYELSSLKDNKMYGNPERYYDSDDTELIRAIYCVVFRNAWPDIQQNLESYKLRGDTLNTFPLCSARYEATTGRRFIPVSTNIIHRQRW